MPGPAELLIVLAIVVVVFGASRLPQLARSLGKAKTEFQKGLNEGDDERSESKKQTPDGAQS